MTHLSLGIGTEDPEGLGQRDPFSGLLRVTLADQGWEEHDKVQPQGLVVVSHSKANEGKVRHNET